MQKAKSTTRSQELWKLKEEGNMFSQSIYLKKSQKRSKKSKYEEFINNSLTEDEVKPTVCCSRGTFKELFQIWIKITSQVSGDDGSFLLDCKLKAPLVFGIYWLMASAFNPCGSLSSTDWLSWNISVFVNATNMTTNIETALAALFSHLSTYSCEDNLFIEDLI